MNTLNTGSGEAQIKIDSTTKWLAGLLIAVLGLAMTVGQPLVSSALTDREWKARVDMRVSRNRDDINALKKRMGYVYDGIKRIEYRIGTLPSDEAPPQSEGSESR